MEAHRASLTDFILLGKLTENQEQEKFYIQRGMQDIIYLWRKYHGGKQPSSQGLSTTHPLVWKDRGVGRREALGSKLGGRQDMLSSVGSGIKKKKTAERASLSVHSHPQS